MPRVSNKKAREYVKIQKAFRGSNIFARELRNGAYCVWSYTEDWPLYVRFCNEWFGNSGWYSRTTHRHKTLLCPGDKISWLPRAVLQLFVALCDSSAYAHSSTSLRLVLRNSGLIPPPTPPSPPTPESPSVTTHLARATVDWGAVHRRRVLPIQ
jgi:hypothetical protein